MKAKYPGKAQDGTSFKKGEDASVLCGEAGGAGGG